MDATIYCLEVNSICWILSQWNISVFPLCKISPCWFKGNTQWTDNSSVVIQTSKGGLCFAFGVIEQRKLRHRHFMDDLATEAVRLLMWDLMFSRRWRFKVEVFWVETSCYVALRCVVLCCVALRCVVLCCVVLCCVVLCCGRILPFQRLILPPSSGWSATRQHELWRVCILPQHYTVSQPRRPRLGLIRSLVSAAEFT